MKIVLIKQVPITRQVPFSFIKKKNYKYKNKVNIKVKKCSIIVLVATLKIPLDGLYPATKHLLLFHLFQENFFSPLFLHGCILLIRQRFMSLVELKYGIKLTNKTQLVL